MEFRLREAVAPWLGTPHRLGGNDRSGVDCSGFVVSIYRKLFQMRLPRTTALLMGEGRPADPRHLVSGDLVFFHIPERKRHVGIYLGGGEFAHASYRRGVTISRVNDAYWRRHFHTARRLL